MFRKATLSLIAVFLLLAACTTSPEPAADPVIIARSTNTVTPISDTLTPLPTPNGTGTGAPVSETTFPTPTAEGTFAPTPGITITPTPYTPMPTPTVTPTPKSFYENVWVGGLLMSQTELWVANSSIPNVLFHNPRVTLQTADPETAERLEMLPTPEALVLIEGDFYNNGPEDFQLVVNAIELVNLPYSAETPLDATYHHANPDFTFDYPAGWFISPVESEGPGILWLNNVPPIVEELGLGIGTEYSDPTKYDLTVGVPDFESIEAYINKVQEADPQLWDLETVQINGRPVPKITSYGLGYSITYLLEVNGTILSFYDWEGDADFMERIISTVR
jgi:hypothetical protein